MNHLVLLENSNIVIQTIDLIDKLEVTSVHFVVQNLYFFIKGFRFCSFGRIGLRSSPEL